MPLFVLNIIFRRIGYSCCYRFFRAKERASFSLSVVLVNPFREITLLT